MKPALFLGLAMLAACGEQASRPVPAPAEPASIAADVFKPYDKATYPKTYAKWGDAAVTGSIQQLREAAARAVAERPECDSVMLAEISDRSSPPAAPEVFVDCTNGSRWRYSGADPVTSRPPDQEHVYGS